MPRTGRVFTKWKPGGYPKFLKFEVEHAINEASLADPENGHKPFEITICAPVAQLDRATDF